MMGKKKTAKMRGGGRVKKTAKMRGGGMTPPVGMKKGGKAPSRSRGAMAAKLMRAARRVKPSGRISADDLFKARTKLIKKCMGFCPAAGRKSSKTMTPGEKKRAFKGKQTKMFADARKGLIKMRKDIKTKKIGKTRA